MLLLMPGPAAMATSPASTERVSVASDGTLANGASGASWRSGASVSADGRYVAFSSFASNLVPGDTNGAEDVFVHDRVTRVTERVSVASDGAEGDGASAAPSISADGRHVAFSAWASNLVAGDTNGTGDVFVHDRVTGMTERVSVPSDGMQSDGGSAAPSISADGRHVAFSSHARNLVPGDTNGAGDVFVHDRVTGVTERVSVASDSTQADVASFWPSISADGRHVAFNSWASNLVAGDTNGVADVFVHDRVTGGTGRVSVASDGTEGNENSWSPSISADGRHVAFNSWASNLVSDDTRLDEDVFVHDRVTRVTERVSVASDGAQGNGHSGFPSISGDGRHVAFSSWASNLVPGDTNEAEDVFVHDRVTGVTGRMSVASDGTQGDEDSFAPSISADGRHVAFSSWASNLVPGDTNGTWNVFVRDRGSAPGGPEGPEEPGDPYSEERERIDQLRDTVDGMGIPHGTARSLDAKLEAADDALADGDVETACNVLRAFINQVRAQTGRHLTLAQAAELIREAEEIRLALGCR